MSHLLTNHVPPSGPLDASILFIGEAPGEEEDNRLIPFIGSAGQFFDQCLKASDLVRREVLVTNCFQQRPPKNNVDYFFQDKSQRVLTWEGEEHIERLRVWMENLLENRKKKLGGPNVVVALGATAMRVLTGKKRITKWRGSVLDCILVPGFKVYPMFHPSFALRLMNEPSEKLMGERKKDQQNILPIFLRDLERVKEQSSSTTYTRPEREFHIYNELDEALGYFNKLIRKADLQNHERKGPIAVACDIETLPTHLGWVVWCIGFAESPDLGVCVPIIKNLAFKWSAKQEVILWRKISEVFLHPNIKIIFHNGMFDMSILGRYYGLRVSEGTFEDTMYGHQMNYPYLRKSLALCTSIYTWEPYYKDEGKVHSGKRISDTSEFIYNCRDVCVTREIWPKILRDARELGTTINYDLTLRVIPSLLHMQIRGVKIDAERKGFLTGLFTKRSVEYEERIKAISENDKLNLRSSTQLRRLLYADLGCKEQFNHKTGKLTTDKDAINRLVKFYKDPSDKRHQILKNLIEFRKYSKLSDTYTAMEVDIAGRVHTSYGWVTTFRLNSSKSHFGGGGNLQNIPVRTEEGKEIRRLFTADEGKILVACDLGQAEAREVAWLAKDERLINLFLDGWDVHWARTKTIFGFADDLVYNENAKISDAYTGESHTMKFYRRLGKTIVHAGNYMMGPRMLQNILIREGVTLSEPVCKKLLFTNKTNNPLISRWQSNTIEEIKATRVLITALGDKRIFRGRLNNSLFRSAIAFRPQSVVGRLLQLAIQKIHVDLLDIFEVLLNVHDEVIGQCYESDIEESIAGIKSRMEIPHTVGGMELIIPCDFRIGYNWGDLKEIVI